jgi:hypothetical protein
MPDAKDPRLALFELYLGTAEKVSDRRAQANGWMLSVNSAIVALYGYLQADKTPLTSAPKPLWLWAIPKAGAIASLAWASLLTSYRKLNHAKFAVLKKMESSLGDVAPFHEEEELYKKEKRRSLAVVESLVPICFLLLFLFLAGVNLVR